MSTGETATGVVYVDPRLFYLALGARLDQGPIPIYDEPTNGEVVGSFDILTGHIVVRA